MDNRYKNNLIFDNSSELYNETLNQKKLKSILQYRTFDFKKLKDINNYNLETIAHTVQPFERLYMISQKYYKSPEYGWIICYTNGLSSELLINAGDVLIIYLPFQTVLGLLK